MGFELAQCGFGKSSCDSLFCVGCYQEVGGQRMSGDLNQPCLGGGGQSRARAVIGKDAGVTHIRKKRELFHCFSVRSVFHPP